MKTFLFFITIYTIASSSLAAAQDVKQSSLVGVYILDQSATDAKYITDRYNFCHEKISVTQSAQGDQFLLRSTDIRSIGQDGTWVKKQPSSIEDGDTGARIDTTKFDENEVADIRQEFGIVGYIREYQGISHPFGNKNRLLFKKSSMLVPLGFLLDDRDIKCIYNRVE